MASAYLYKDKYEKATVIQGIIWLMDFAAFICEQTPADLGGDWRLLNNLTEEEVQNAGKPTGRLYPGNSAERV